MPLPHTPTEDASTVLLVDDSPDALMLLSLELQRAGFRVTSAGSGEEALAHLALQVPDAVLLDVLMPGMDGFETCRRIRAGHPHLPVIFMTGLGETEHILRGFEVGGTDYVTKPLAPSVVVARLHVHTRVAGLVRATREALNASEVAMLAVDGQGRLVWRNAATATLLQSLVPGFGCVEGQKLPGSLAALQHGSNELSLNFAAGALQAHRVTTGQQPMWVYTLTRHAPSRLPAQPLPKLTDREGEVLLWVARGKTNRDIADILGMSPRTVAKHMEHIFEKLGVETRTAAAGAARHWQSPPIK